jgi:nucleoside-diphosphate-sugar epimerase
VRALLLPEERAPVWGSNVQIVRGDITWPASLGVAFDGVRRVYHLAAHVGDWGPEELFQAVNVEGTRHVLDAAVSAGCERVVAISSVVVYGTQLWGGECDENAPREHGCGPYSRSKRAAEELALSYHDLGRVQVTVVRPGNVYGPEARLWVDTVAGTIRAGRWLHIDDGDGDAVLAYVDNVVDVIARAGVCPGSAGRIYNANDGSGVTWRRYARDLAALVGAREPTRSVPRSVAIALGWGMESAWRMLRRGERPLVTREAATLLASRSIVPIAQARADLGYVPPVTYADAIGRVAEYLRSAHR